MSTHINNYPKLHNAMWPGLVGKGSPGAEPCIDLDTMLNLTAAAEVDGVKFDGVDIFLFDPHINIDISNEDLKRIADKITAHGLVVGSVVAPIWPPTGGGSAMGSAEERAAFVGQVRKGCRIAAKLRELGVRPNGVVRLDSAAGVLDWEKDPEGNTKLIAQTFSEACDVAESFGERLAAEGEICWGGMHGWKQMVNLLELVGRPKTLGFQADMAHTLLYTMGYNAPEGALLPADYDWKDQSLLDDALKQLTAALRPWTIDFHVAQNDGTVFGSGSHEKTGHHCQATDPNGKLDITRHAGYWLRDENGRLTQSINSICWDGCMFSNEVMTTAQTWNDILAAMIAVRDAHGWREITITRDLPETQPAVEVTQKVAKSAPVKASAPKARPVKTSKPTPKKAAPIKKAAIRKTVKVQKPVVKKAVVKKVAVKKAAVKKAVIKKAKVKPAPKKVTAKPIMKKAASKKAAAKPVKKISKSLKAKSAAKKPAARPVKKVVKKAVKKAAPIAKKVAGKGRK